jgi:nucleoside-diphosphate-sugar epimerase
MKKAIVTGGAGFIGSNLSDALIEKGYEVHVVDVLTESSRNNINPKAVLHEVDIRDLGNLKKIFHGVSYVFHCAALPRVQYSIEHPVETHDANVNGTLNVLIAAKEAGAKKVVYSASSSAYGDQPTMPLVESMPASPKSPYGLHKYVGELYCRVWSEVYQLPTVSLRYFNVYGPRQSEEGAYALVIAKFLKLRREGKPMTITGDGKQTRDFTHVRDVVRANILAAESESVIGGPVEYIPARFEPHDTLADNTKARELLGWVPEVKIEEGVEELKALYL